MQCPSCSAPVSESDTSCSNCGLLLESDPTVAFVPIQGAQHPALTRDEASALGGIHGFALVVERGPRAGMTFLLSPGATTVGRHPDSDIFLDDITVSRQHCRFLVTESSLSVEDSGSTNGTYVNGARVDRAALSPGDEVLVGRFHLIVAQGND